MKFDNKVNTVTLISQPGRAPHVCQASVKHFRDDESKFLGLRLKKAAALLFLSTTANPPTSKLSSKIRRPWHLSYDVQGRTKVSRSKSMNVPWLKELQVAYFNPKSTVYILIKSNLIKCSFIYQRMNRKCVYIWKTSKSSDDFCFSSQLCSFGLSLFFSSPSFLKAPRLLRT